MYKCIASVILCKMPFFLATVYQVRNGYFEKEKPRACQGGLIHSNLYLSWKPDQMRAVFKVSSDFFSTIFNRQFFFSYLFR